MTLANDYQQQAARTLIERPDNTYTNEEMVLVLNALRLAGEAVAIANTVKKAVFHRHPLNRAGLHTDLLQLIDSAANLETPDQAPRCAPQSTAGLTARRCGPILDRS